MSKGFVFIKERLSYNDPNSIIVGKNLVRSQSNFNCIFAQLMDFYELAEFILLKKDADGYSRMLFVLKKK